MIAHASSAKQRLSTFQKKLSPHQLALISDPIEIFYFTSFPHLAPTEREAFLLVGPKTAVLFHHSFSPLKDKQSWLKTVPKTNLQQIAQEIQKLPAQQLLIDENNLNVAEFKQLKNLVKIPLQPLKSKLIWQLREIKDDHELKLMRQAGQLAVKVFQQIKKELKTGMTEQQVANRIDSLILKNGGQGTAFPTIVAFGPHGALPHHQPTDTKLKSETPVLIDLGVKYQSYLSDFTRTFWFGRKPAKKFQQIEQIVKAAYRETLLALQKRSRKLTAAMIDDTARQYIADQGFSEQFIHTTGHGLGLEIHEPPSLFWQSQENIKPGMTITIEPGIYLPGEFGYRYENTVVVTDNSAKELTTL